MKRIVSIVILLLVAAALLLLFNRNAGTSEGGAGAITAPGPKFNRPDSPQAAPPAALERSTLADELNAPGSDVQRDLRLVTEIVATFRTNFLQAGNPTGTNAEITSALSGKNQLRLALIPPDHGAINREGELCDRWGSPFFFHAESATRMEIRSAGPDRKMWTDDDVAFAP